MPNNPKVSIIIPVYNTELYLEQCLDSFLAQTFTDFEIVCVDDGSSDSSVNILERYAKSDERIRILHQENRGAGAARNYGFSRSSGEYAIFFDSDDYCDKRLLELAVNKIEAEQADIVAFEFYRFYPDGTKELRTGVNRNWLPKGTQVFNYKTCPDRIMNVVNPTPWNKLYRSSFIREKNLRFEEISTSNDVTFASVSVASANKIAALGDALVYYRVGIGGTITSRKYGRFNDVLTAVSSAARQAERLPYYDEIKNAVIFFGIEICLTSLYRYAQDVTHPSVESFYKTLHEYFNSEDIKDINRDILGTDTRYNRFLIIQKNTYEEYRKLRSRRMIVSVTSYPARIGGVASVLETIYAQSHPADEVLLWLAEEQFPGKESELPDELVSMSESGKLTIKWCEDLKPHKKYFYAFKEYPEDIIVTIDDDMLYEQTLLERLYDSYLMFPGAVSAMRTHLMAIDDNGEILPYNCWIRSTDGYLYKPSMQLFAVGAGGILYPPGILEYRMLDEAAVRETCIFADDIWLKAMEILAGVPVVTADRFKYGKYVEGSQEAALCNLNVDQEYNDIQFKNVIAWVDRHFEKRIINQRLLIAENGKSLAGFKAFSGFVAREYERLRSENSQTRRRLDNAYRDNNIRKEKLQQARDERLEIKAKLQRTYDEKSEINAKLQRTYAEKSEINRKLQITYKEKAERGIRIKELEAELKAANSKPIPYLMSGMRKLIVKIIKKISSK